MIPPSARSPELQWYYDNRRPDGAKHGGSRPCPTGCACGRHGKLRPVAPTVEREGDVARISCGVCGRKLAGTFTDDEVAALVEAHRHGKRARGGRSPAQKELIR